jgi:acetyl-CoA C-acetyltransferase
VGRGLAPVIVGVGQVVQHPSEAGIAGPLDAVGLMVAAARRAGDDAAAPRLLARVGMVLVPEGTWPAGNAGHVVADRLGAAGARTVLARVGVLQTTPLAMAAGAIAAGELDVALVVGGEAKARSARPRAESLPPPGPADDELAADGEIVTAVEIERGLAVPVQSYAVQEHALAHHRRESVAEHRVRLARLWASFAAVAAGNSYAWDRTAASTTVEDIADPGAPGNRMVSTPYTRRHCSQWNVDQGVALLLCAAEVADAAGVPDSGRVHPLAIVESNAMIPVSRRADLHRSPAVEVIGRHLARLGAEPAAADHLDLYSCFPSAVQIQAAELGVDLARPLTVTGGMGFAGGPLNSSALHAVAAMVEAVRADPGSTGLVTAVSGMLTKQGAIVLSTDEAGTGFRVVDVSEEARSATCTIEVDPGYTGEAVVDGATVVHDREGPASAVVVATTSEGRRAVATTTDRQLVGALAEDPGVGELVRVDGPTLLG